MNTILDSCKTLFLDELVYSGNLQILVSEGFILDQPHTIQLSKETIDVKPIEQTQESRQFKIQFDFSHLINFQLIDESFTAFDKNETQDTKGFIQLILNSEYLRFVDKSHGWYKEVIGDEGKHYRVWTEDDVIDVISLKGPTIERNETVSYKI